MGKGIEKYSEATFESIKHVNSYGQEYWTARELQHTLEYADWRNFETVIEKAQIRIYRSYLKLEMAKIKQSRTLSKLPFFFKLGKSGFNIINQ